MEVLEWLMGVCVKVTGGIKLPLFAESRENGRHLRLYLREAGWDSNRLKLSINYPFVVL